MPFLDHCLPVGLAMPSSFRVRVMSRMPLPASARSKMRLHHWGGLRVRFQGGAFLGPVLDHQLAIAVGHSAGDPEAPRSGLPHSPQNFLRKIFAIKFVHRSR